MLPRKLPNLEEVLQAAAVKTAKNSEMGEVFVDKTTDEGYDDCKNKDVRFNGGILPLLCGRLF